MGSISRDDARDRVAKEFYGDTEIRLNNFDYKLSHDRGPYTPPGKKWIALVPPWRPEEADALAVAVGREALSRAQGQTVDEWLALYGFDCSERDCFDQAAFDAALSGPMGQAIREERERWLRQPGAAVGDGEPDPQPQAERRKGGARARYDWPAIEAEILRLMEKNGDFAPTKRGWDAQARLEEAIVDFCGPDSAPSESTLRPKLWPIIDSWRASRVQANEASDHSDRVEEQ
jgi:hypothetical protein